MYKLYIENQTGAYFCHRCGTGGSWYDFKANLNGGYDGLKDSAPAPSYSYQSRNNSQRFTGKHPSVEQTPLPLPPPRLSGYCSSRLLDPQSNQEKNPVLDYLTEVRGLDRLTLRKYGVGRAIYKFPGDKGYEEAECVTFPWMLRESELRVQEDLREVQFPKEDADDETSDASQEGETVKEPSDPFVTRRIKVRAVQEKSWQRLDPAGGGWGLFGWHTVPPDATEIILTEGEYDAMAVHQGTGRLAVSLPNGCRSLPVQVLPLLERFEKIILWMDNDLPGQEGADKFAKKLGLNRSYIVRCREAKDANEALLKGLDMNSYLDTASLVPHDRIMTFSDLREDVLHELLKPDLYSGVPVPSLPKLTQLMKGFRRGELTVLTGPTGSGKTTFLGQVSLDMAEQGINVLWGSFEIKNTRLVHKLLKQYSRDLLPDITSENAEQAYNALCDRFGTLPFHFMGFHGGSEVDEVLDAMEYAVYVNDAEHIILDNMQFMITRNVAGASTWDKFDTQDIAIEKFRKFATEHNVHLTLVVHPRKEDEAAKLNISSFYGSAKATQEADTVLILQNDGRRKYIEVKKNRFDGTLGHVPLYFQSKSGRYMDHEDSSPVLLAATDYFQHSRRGKGFRPTIVTLLAKALEQVPDSHPDVWNKQGILSQIIEMIHVASLMHDDIIDDAHTRRGGPAAHRKFSPKVAVLAGDFLLARASLFLGRLDNTEVVQVMAQALEALVSGEIMQQTKSPESLLAMESYIIKSYHKTASLIAHACRSTALLAGHESNSTVTQQCDEIGFHMGLAYQIQDDILDLTQSSKDLGKPALVDMSLGLGTAPILYAAQEDSSLAPLIARRFREPGDVQAAWEALQRRPTAMYKARVLACFHAQKAVDALYKLPPSDERDALIRLTHMIIDRKK
eukprot:Nitzschia sp. Nitz4//scaffold73_size107353//30756//34545//NITZ4_004311-RA/size107353-processed-gene-0.20-mRNA-1//-1//CDS//3329557449//3282//frame0